MTPISSNKVSPAFKEVLKIPTSKSGQKHKNTRIPLPKAISGKKFYDLLEKKQIEKRKKSSEKKLGRRKVKSKESAERKKSYRKQRKRQRKNSCVNKKKKT